MFYWMNFLIVLFYYVYMRSLLFDIRPYSWIRFCQFSVTSKRKNGIHGNGAWCSVVWRVDLLSGTDLTT
jgi:hypothetical protein